jgi:hypothetical protein
MALFRYDWYSFEYKVTLLVGPHISLEVIYEKSQLRSGVRLANYTYAPSHLAAFNWLVDTGWLSDIFIGNNQ